MEKFEVHLKEYISKIEATEILRKALEELEQKLENLHYEEIVRISNESNNELTELETRYRRANGFIVLARKTRVSLGRGMNALDEVINRILCKRHTWHINLD